MSGEGDAVRFKEPNLLVATIQAFLTGTMMSSYYGNYVQGLGLRGSERMLEYGSGPGSASKHLARALGNGGHLTCVDISEVWIGFAKRAVGKYPNVDFQLGDIAAMDITDGSYDAVFIHFVLHDVPEAIRREKVGILVRKLKAGGKVYVREPTGDRHGMPASEIRAILAENGLKEVSAGIGKNPNGWPTFHCVYVK